MGLSSEERARIKNIYHLIDSKGTNNITSKQILNSYSKLYELEDREFHKDNLDNLISAFSTNKGLNYEQLCSLIEYYNIQMIPSYQLQKENVDSLVCGLIKDISIQHKAPPIRQNKYRVGIYEYLNSVYKNIDWSTPKYLLAGGIAGAVSRTLVSPLERLKILFQVQGPSNTNYHGVYSTLAKIWREEGIMGYLRGNGTNVIRIVPYSAIQFAAYERYKKLLMIPGEKELTTPRRLAAGALAGITSVTFTYPLDIVRTRLSVQSTNFDKQGKTTSTNSKTNIKTNTTNNPQIRSSSIIAQPKLPGIVETLNYMYKNEGGIRALYRGIYPTLMGVAPYVALNFQSYETLRVFFTPPGENSPTGINKLICGALAGCIAQTCTYPLDVLRRRMQVTGMKSAKMDYKNSIDAIKKMYIEEGFRAFYKGMVPNYMKVAPAIGVSFYMYEWCKNFMEV